MRSVFQVAKTTQAAAQFLKLGNGSVSKYILIKLLYLLDRESMLRRKTPFTGDTPVSMEHGPVLSRVYDLTKSEPMAGLEHWGSFISPPDEETNEITLVADPGRDEISDAEIKLIAEIHQRFGSLTWAQMKKFCHSLPEYEDVGKSSKPISFEKLFHGSGRSKEDLHEFNRVQVESNILSALLDDKD